MSKVIQSLGAPIREGDLEHTSKRWCDNASGGEYDLEPSGLLTYFESNDLWGK